MAVVAAVTAAAVVVGIGVAGVVAAAATGATAGDSLRGCACAARGLSLVCGTHDDAV